MAGASPVRRHCGSAKNVFSVSRKADGNPCRGICITNKYAPSEKGGMIKQERRLGVAPVFYMVIFVEVIYSQSDSNICRLFCKINRYKLND